MGMGGLQLGVGGRFSGRAGVQTRAQPGYSQGAGPAGAGAFGSGASVTPPGGAGTLAPNDPVGVALWASVGSVLFLAWVRHTLPANMKRLFDLDLMILVGGHLSYGVVRMEARKMAASSNPILQTIGGASNIALGS